MGDSRINYLEQAKACYNATVEFFDELEAKGVDISRRGYNANLRDILRLDIGSYMMYLSLSDGNLSDNEVALYQYITDFKDSAENILSTIKELNIYSKDYESEPPLILRLLDEIENEIFKGGYRAYSSLPKLAELYKFIGVLVVSIDGGISQNESRDLGIINGTIDAYIQKALNNEKFK